MTQAEKKPRIASEIDRSDNRAELYAALYEMTDIYWGVNDAQNGDGGFPPNCIQRARRALRNTMES